MEDCIYIKTQKHRLKIAGAFFAFRGLCKIGVRCGMYHFREIRIPIIISKEERICISYKTH
jgi:hypothetical protein